MNGAHWYESLNAQMMCATVELYDEEGDAFVAVVPFRFEACWNCHGKGSHVNRAIDGHGISREEFDEDPDFEEAYFSGAYDVACDECGGDRVVAVTDDERVQAAQQSAADYARECEAERMAGA